MDTVFGYIESITFQNAENGYTIAQLKQKNQLRPTCIIGSMPGLFPGQTVRCQGSWKNHLVYGRQFVVTEFRVEAPPDVIGVRKYLGSGLIKGIGHTYANRIVDKFGVDTFEIIDQSPERLLEVEGIGKKRVERLVESWKEQKSIRDVMVVLQSFGISPAYAQKIYKAYGNLAVAKLKESPFNLARDIRGIGFKIADGIAKKMGIPKEAPLRIEAGIEHILEELSQNGHVCYPLDLLVVEAEKILEVSLDLIVPHIQILKEENRIELMDLPLGGSLRTFAWLRPLFLAETGIARELVRLQRSASHLRKIDLQKALAWVQAILNLQLAENQKNGVGKACQDKIHIVTGGPGTGKSTITKAILAITSQLTDQIVLAAPTGRAAKRMSEITKRKASTLHSLLEYDLSKGGFKKNRENPLSCDLIIVDEASMIDTYLMYSLLKALPDHARLILIGDINQLPSVGPGNVLKDIISSNFIPVTHLNEIYRQAAGSRIITNAHNVNKGVLPELKNLPDSDFFFFEIPSAEEVEKQIVSLVTQRLPKKYGFDPFQDIQVLAPMKRGVIGTENLNISLQKALNPRGNPFFIAGKGLCVGDKVMQIRNNYKLEVYNGDIGRILKIDTVGQQLLVQFEDREVIYEFSQMDELVLSYAVSIHKYQGSECRCVIIPVHQSHYILLTRNLLYTGLTRGKELVVLLGTSQAVRMAVSNNDVQHRYTGLQQAIIGYSTPALSYL